MGNQRISELKCGASLAHHGLLSSVNRLSLYIIDLSPVPAQHLASLVSCVTNHLDIWNVSGCDLTSIVTSAKCGSMSIYGQSLGREETRALVQAMESGVKEVRLTNGVTLDIEILTEYSGQGVCRKVELFLDASYRADRYREGMRTWARSRNWRVSDGNKFLFTIKSGD